jgi:hypothetical protein
MRGGQPPSTQVSLESTGFWLVGYITNKSISKFKEQQMIVIIINILTGI